MKSSVISPTNYLLRHQQIRRTKRGSLRILSSSPSSSIQWSQRSAAVIFSSKLSKMFGMPLGICTPTSAMPRKLRTPIEVETWKKWNMGHNLLPNSSRICMTFGRSLVSFLKTIRFVPNAAWSSGATLKKTCFWFSRWVEQEPRWSLRMDRESKPVSWHRRSLFWGPSRRSSDAKSWWQMLDSPANPLRRALPLPLGIFLRMGVLSWTPKSKSRTYVVWPM